MECARPRAQQHKTVERPENLNECALTEIAAPGDAAPYTDPQSRRDCVLQPRVARNELPWVMSACAPQLRRSCAINRNNAMPQSLRRDYSSEESVQPLRG